MAIVTAAPSLERYRTNHVIKPKLVAGGIQVCETDDIRIWASAGFRWRHDQATLQRLYEEDIARLISAVVPTYVSPAVCPTCVDGGPPHNASPRCESGSRNHCSCDACF